MPAANLNLRLEPLQWLQMRFAVPGDWEIVRHSALSRQGQLQLIDRRVQRLLLSWLTCDRAPDWAQVFRDYRKRDEGEHPEAKFEELTAGLSWHGYRLRTPEWSLTRTGRWSIILGRWIEMVLHWPEEFDPDLETAVLAGFEVMEGPQANRVRAFGIDIDAGADWTLNHAKVKPADAALTFAKGSSQAVIRRRGLINPDDPADPVALLRRWREDLAAEPSSTVHYQHPAAVSQQWIRSTPLQRWLGLGKWRRDLLWVCPTQGASFHLTTTTTRNSRDYPTDFKVFCCEGGVA